MANQGLPKGEGQGEIARELGKTNAQVFGLIGKQQQQLNSMNRAVEDFVSAIDAGNDSNEVLLNNLINRTEKLVELFRPVSKHFTELSEGQGEITGASPASVNFGKETDGKDDTGGKEVEKKGNFLLDMLKNLTAGVGGLVAGVGGVVGGLGLGALGLGLRGLAPGLVAMANPATALGGTVLVAFLAGLAGVAYLSGKAMQEIGEGFTGMGQGLNDLAEANVPEGEQLTTLATAFGVLFNSFDTTDAIKTAILDGSAFSSMATGLEDLSAANFEPQAIDRAGAAIAGFFDTVGFGDAAKSRILDGSSFSGLAEGLQMLNDINVDPEKLAQAGLGANKFLSSIVGFKSGLGATMAAVFEMDYLTVAASIKALNDINADAKKLENAGVGLREFLQNLTEVKVSGILKTKFLNEEMFTQIADGLIQLNDAGMVLDVANIEKLRDGLLTILRPAGDNLVGIIATQMIDDNLVPMAEGMSTIHDTASGFDVKVFENLLASSLLMQQALDIPFTTAFTVSMIDDNLIPFAEGIKKIDTIGSEIDVENFKNLKGAMGELMAAFQGEDGKADSFFKFWETKDDFKLPITDKDLKKLKGLTEFIAGLSTSDFNKSKIDLYDIVYPIKQIAQMPASAFTNIDKLGKQLKQFTADVDEKALLQIGNGLVKIGAGQASIISGGSADAAKNIQMFKNQQVEEKARDAETTGLNGNVFDNSTNVVAPTNTNISGGGGGGDFSSPIQNPYPVYT